MSRIIAALAIVMLLVQLYACAAKEDTKSASPATPSPSSARTASVDPRALFRIGSDIVTGPDAHPLRARFTKAGALLARASDGMQMSLRMSAAGRSGSMARLDASSDPTLVDSRVTYAKAASISEWFEPTLKGLEHGAIIEKRPIGSGLVRIDMEIDHDLEAVASRVAGEIELRRGGVPAFHYGALDVADAKGKKLPATLEPGGFGRITIAIDDALAAYPITIDPLIWALQTKLVSLVAEEGDFFGGDVAISGDNILVGSYGRRAFEGGAAAFRRSGTSWVHEKFFDYANVPNGRNFGLYLSIAGDEAMIGSENAATLVNRVNGIWTVDRVLQPPFLLGAGQFGAAVARQGNIAAIVNSRRDATQLEDGGVIPGGADGGPPTEGAIFVFERTGSSWSLKAALPLPYITPPGFYAKIALDGDTLVVGIGFHLLVFRRANDGTWGFEAVIAQPTEITTPFFGNFGSDVEIVGNTIAATNYPLVEIFTRGNGQWTHTQTIPPTNFGGSAFGSSIAFAGDNLFVNDPVWAGTGAVYRFRRVGDLFAIEEQIAPSSLTTSSQFGAALATTTDTAVFSAPTQGALTGAAYVYALASSLGEPCTKGESCGSGFCVDGVCCDSACGGGAANDCRRCDGALTRGTCSVAAAGGICRVAASECDVVEVCDGVRETCPANSVRPNGTTCSGGQCLAGECRALAPSVAPSDDGGVTPFASPPPTTGCSAAPVKSDTGIAGCLAVIFGGLALRRRPRSRSLSFIARAAIVLLAALCPLLHETGPRKEAYLELASPDQELRVRLSGSGAAWVDDATGVISTSTLERFGRRSAMRAVAVVDPKESGSRVIYERGALVEWYEAQGRGIEQGFDVVDRPPGDGPLVLALRGDVGVAGLNYGELHAVDRSSRALPARLERYAGGMSIEVDDADALYPITIDPLVWRERNLIEATPPMKLSSFGAVMATRDDLVFAASPFASRPVEVFQRTGVAFAELARFSPIEVLSPVARFGGALAVDGDRVVVGAFYDADFTGRAFVFERSGTSWKQTGTLLPDPDLARRSLFGSAVAISGNTIAVGAPDAGITGPFVGPGVVYVFALENGVWLRQARLQGFPTTVRFGQRLALEKDTLIVSATLGVLTSDFNGDEVHFLKRSGSTWATDVVVTDPARARLGAGIALQGDTAVLGGPAPSYGTPVPMPFVDVYSRTNGAWAKAARLQPEDPSHVSFFGGSIALRGQRLVVGAPGKNQGRGAAYLFEGAGATWAQKQRFVASDGNVDDHFGATVDFSNDMVVIGSPERNTGTGAIYTYFQGLQGDPCKSGDICASGFCIDEVCCDSECGAGNDSDCQACSVKKGAAKDGVCGPAKGNTCRPARDGDECDVAESCDGEHLDCPADVTAPNGKQCNAGTGQCGGGRCLTFSSVSTSDAGTPSEPPPEEGGCAVATTSSSTWLAPILGIALLAFLRRRRP